MPTTTNMNMELPTVGVTLDPTWASNLNDALTNKIDLHDHTTGLGVRVPTAGLNINADLSFGSNDATDLRSVALNNNVATLPSGDVRALYASGGNLYYNNNSGTPIQITTGSSLDTGSLALNVWELTELAGNLTILSADSFIVVNTDTSAARTINLPAASSVTAGRYLIFKDKTGDAASNNITVVPNGSDTIDETASSTTVNTAYGSLTLISDGVSNWLTNASLGGFVKLGGDLLGTGSTVLQPRVGSLTGIAGLVTMANNTAINTRNLANDTNVNLAKMNTSNLIQLADSAFASILSATTFTVTASADFNVTAADDVSIVGTDDVVITGTDTLFLEATNGNMSLQTGNELIIGAIGDANISSVSNMVITATNDWQMTANRDIGVDALRDISIDAVRNLTLEGVDITATATTGDFTVTCGDDGYISAHDSMTVAGNSLTLRGAMYWNTKAVTSASYTVDTTTPDVIIYVDSTSTAISINLPAASNGRILWIQDVGGNANTNNITLVRNGSDTIQGVGSNYVMDADFQGVMLAAYSGASWFIIG